MNVIIIEDEHHAAKRLQKILTEINHDISVLQVIDSVEDSVNWLNENDHPNLIFMDIQLADGISFSIFDQVEINTPVIFTTAYDEYSLNAFKVNSIDYLLKPIDESELEKAFIKFEKLNQKNDNAISSFNKLIQNLQTKKIYKERFLIKSRDKYTFLLSDEIAYFFSEESMTFLVNKEGKSFILDGTLNNLEEELDPKIFFRINRKQIIHIQSISEIHNYFNSRLKLELKPSSKSEALVSREKVKDFKDWLGA